MAKYPQKNGIRYRMPVLLLGVLGVPHLAFAQQDFKSIVGSVTEFLLSLVPILSSLALLFFFWGLVQYVFQAGNQQAVEQSRQRMLWGIVGLFVIATIWALVTLVGGSFNLL